MDLKEAAHSLVDGKFWEAAGVDDDAEKEFMQACRIVADLAQALLDYMNGVEGAGRNVMAINKLDCIHGMPAFLCRRGCNTKDIEVGPHGYASEEGKRLAMRLTGEIECLFGACLHPDICAKARDCVDQAPADTLDDLLG